MTSGTPSSGDVVIEVTDLMIRYGDIVAVDTASFVAHAGEVTVLLGPNGAGKTSLVEHLEGYRPASGGQARVLGLDPVRDHGTLVQRVGIMLQDGGIQPAIRPQEVLRQYAGFFPNPLDVDDLLGGLGLAHCATTTVRRLSGGERQRLSLALALIGRPEVLLLDEPTAGVDLEGREQVRTTLESLRCDGVGVLLTTHDLDEAERVADRVVVIDRGRIAAEGSLAEITSHSDNSLQFRCHGSLDVTALAAALGAVVRASGQHSYTIDAPADPDRIARLTSWLAAEGLTATEIRASGTRLEDVYRTLIVAHDHDGTDRSTGGAS